VNFSGGNVSSDGGTLLLRQFERKLGLLRRTSKIIAHHDYCQDKKFEHDGHEKFFQNHQITSLFTA